MPTVTTQSVNITIPTVTLSTSSNKNEYKVDTSTITSSFIPFFTSSITNKPIEKKNNNCYCKLN
jgi:hypothetical protein